MFHIFLNLIPKEFNIPAGDNPDYCTAFRYSVDGRDLRPSLPCCWPGRHGVVIPSHLKSIVDINKDNKM
jgi:hypothetical protein